jgi:hypothetical protein
LCWVFLLANFYLQEEDKELVLRPPFGTDEVDGSWRRAPPSRMLDIDFLQASLVGNASSNKVLFHESRSIVAILVYRRNG